MGPAGKLRNDVAAWNELSATNSWCARIQATLLQLVATRGENDFAYLPIYLSFLEEITKEQIIAPNMDESSNNSQHVIQMAQEVLNLAQENATQGLRLQEKLMKSILKLQIAAQGPASYVFRKRNQPVEHVCILIAIQSGLLEAIVERDGASVSAAELAKKTELEELLIVRVMRLLTAIDVFDEVSENTYRSNSTSAFLNNPGQRAGMELVTEVVFPIASNLVTQKRADALHQFLGRTNNGEKSFFELTFSKSYFDYLGANPKSRQTYDSLMAARRDGLGPDWFQIYPAAEELGGYTEDGGEGAALLVDVGGNHGHATVKFRQQCPQVKGRCVLQDLPESLSGIKKPLDSIEVMAYDFFTPQPVKGARAYLFKAVCHDFTDQQCRDFLGNTAKAMNSTSSILIDDWVLPDYEAPIQGVSVDIMMMLLHAGLERSLSQWHKLLDSIGLRIVKVWPSKGFRESVIEAKLK